jgi:diadenosine tetraphosphatase ApaH/serine/threonine PP2A family protein phosphatase
MRTAIISDIHGNLEALDAVLRAATECGVDCWACLGDIVGYGADPHACLQRVRTTATQILRGNHDAAVAGTEGLDGFNPVAREAALWTATQLSSAERAFLGTLPLALEHQDALLVHAEPANPEDWGYVFSAHEARRALEATDAHICFAGHTHCPLACVQEHGATTPCELSGNAIELDDHCRYFFNVGSVGQPRDGDPRACFVLWDADSKTVEFQRVEYDVEGARGKILDANLPPFLADRLVSGR